MRSDEGHFEKGRWVWDPTIIQSIHNDMVEKIKIRRNLGVSHNIPRRMKFNIDGFTDFIIQESPLCKKGEGIVIPGGILTKTLYIPRPYFLKGAYVDLFKSECDYYQSLIEEIVNRAKEELQKPPEIKPYEPLYLSVEPEMVSNSPGVWDVPDLDTIIQDMKQVARDIQISRIEREITAWRKNNPSELIPMIGIIKGK